MNNNKFAQECDQQHQKYDLTTLDWKINFIDFESTSGFIQKQTEARENIQTVD